MSDGVRFIPACAGNSPGRPTNRRRRRQVHPRVCGELALERRGLERRGGSSPRVRGTRRHGLGRGREDRFIPACAGNSTVAATSPIQRGGSSPRVRGTRKFHRISLFRRRFIPACAGNSQRLVTKWRASFGSSPRVRGTRRLRGRARAPARFIPACAGNSRQSGAALQAPPVHPRVCGELTVAQAGHFERVGSSPRVRGTPWASAFNLPAWRFIPACAGNSRISSGIAPTLSVHPRVCGELWATRLQAPAAGGSSPRVRGTRARRRPRRSAPPVHPRVCGELREQAHVHLFVGRFIPACAGNSQVGLHRQRRHRRFIPACAGNSVRATTPHSPTPVHPRVCGELDGVKRRKRDLHGSSPRVRGTRRARHADGVGERFIPACAGNSGNPVPFPFGYNGSSPRVRGTRQTTRTD